jgi:hypothetical protein
MLFGGSSSATAWRRLQARRRGNGRGSSAWRREGIGGDSGEGVGGRDLRAEA